MGEAPLYTPTPRILVNHFLDGTAGTFHGRVRRSDMVGFFFFFFITLEP